MISKAAADHAATVDHTGGVFGKDTLPGGIDASSKDAPLTAVRVSADRQIHVGFLDVWDEVFGMMAEQKLKALAMGELL